MNTVKMLGLVTISIAYLALNAEPSSADLVVWTDTSAGGDGNYVFGNGTSLQRLVSFTSSGTNVRALSGSSNQPFNADGNWPFQNADDSGNATVHLIESGLSGPSNDAQLLIDFDGGAPIGTVFFAGQIFNTGTSNAIGSMSLEFLDSTNSLLNIASHISLDSDSYAGEVAGNETPVPTQINTNSIVLFEPISDSTNGGYRVMQISSNDVDKIRVTFEGQGPADFRGLGLGINAVTVPEPSSAILCLVGACSLVFLRRRRHQAGEQCREPERRSHANLN